MDRNYRATVSEFGEHRYAVDESGLRYVGSRLSAKFGHGYIVELFKRGSEGKWVIVGYGEWDADTQRMLWLDI